MAAITSFRATNSCHLVSENEDSAAPMQHAAYVRQFLIFSTFVHVETNKMVMMI